VRNEQELQNARERTIAISMIDIICKKFRGIDFEIDENKTVLIILLL
jgi:hypothetical protein